MLEHVIFFACGASYYHYNYYTHVVTILFIREVLLKKSIDTTRVVSVGIIVQYNICVVVVIMSVESFDRISNSVDNQKISSQKIESSGLSAAMHVPLIIGMISEFETPKVPVHGTVISIEQFQHQNPQIVLMFRLLLFLRKEWHPTQCLCCPSAQPQNVHGSVRRNRAPTVHQPRRRTLSLLRVQTAPAYPWPLVCSKNVPPADGASQPPRGWLYVHAVVERTFQSVVIRAISPLSILERNKGGLMARITTDTYH